MLFTSINTNATTTKVGNGSELLIESELLTESKLLYLSCFEAARLIVIQIYGEINIGNVHHVLTLTALCEENQQ